MAPKRKLIEVALPLEAISRESAREKSIRHGHPSTLHLWWARRPLAAVRAVLWSSLVDDPSAHPGRFPTAEDQKTERKRLFDILERLVVWENSNDPDVLAEAKAEIKASCGDDLPNVLDPFCGGGGGPLEAQRLGLPAYGGDLNPVPVLITKAMVEIPPRFAGRPPVNPRSRAESGLKTWEGAQGLAEDIRYYGQWMRERAWERIGHLYPKVDGKTVIAWLWARTVQSPDPSWKGHVPLLKSGVLRKAKKNKPVAWVEPIVNRDTQTVTYQVREGGTPRGGTMGRGGGVCVATGAPIGFKYIREQGRLGLMSESPIGVVLEGNPGRIYQNPSKIPDASPAGWKPTGRLVGKAANNVPLYGMTEWGDLFTDRQLSALNAFSDLLEDVRAMAEADALHAGLDNDKANFRDGGTGNVAYADAMTTYLSFALDRCAVRWNSLSRWWDGGEKVQGLFGRQAVAMVWDYAEANPFSSSTGNWLGQVEWVARAVAILPSSQFGEVCQRDAVARLGEINRLFGF